LSRKRKDQVANVYIVTQDGRMLKAFTNIRKAQKMAVSKMVSRKGVGKEFGVEFGKGIVLGKNVKRIISRTGATSQHGMKSSR